MLAWTRESVDYKWQRYSSLSFIIDTFPHPCQHLLFHLQIVRLNEPYYYFGKFVNELTQNQCDEILYSLSNLFAGPTDLKYDWRAHPIVFGQWFLKLASFNRRHMGWPRNVQLWIRSSTETMSGKHRETQCCVLVAQNERKRRPEVIAKAAVMMNHLSKDNIEGHFTRK